MQHTPWRVVYSDDGHADVRDQRGYIVARAAPRFHRDMHENENIVDYTINAGNTDERRANVYLIAVAPEFGDSSMKYAMHLAMMFGPGDEVTWPKCDYHPNDPRTPEFPDDVDEDHLWEYLAEQERLAAEEAASDRYYEELYK